MKYLKFRSIKREQDFYKELRNKVESEFNSKSIRYGNASFWFKGIFWISISYLFYVLLLKTHTGSLFWLFFLIFQISGLLIGFSLGHDASHNTAFKTKITNQVLHFFSFLTVGIDPLLWGLRHIRSHHLYANVEGSDIDIDENPFLRLAPSHPWSRKHKYQFYYAPFVYMLALLHSVFIGDWVYLFSNKYSWMRHGIAPKQLYFRFFLFKIIYFALVLGLPILITEFSFGFILFTYASTSAFTSLVFVIMLVGTHFFHEADYYKSDTNELESSWAIHQLKTSCDWNPNNTLARFVSGGSNCHAAHHLFPNICHTYYDKINHIIEDTTKAYDFPYHKKTLIKMIQSHFKHLREMGNPYR